MIHMEKDIYICNSVYHIYVTLLKKINSRNKSDIIISEGIHNHNDLMKKIIESNIFNNVYTVNEMNIGIPVAPSIKRFLSYGKHLISCFERVLDINFESYDNVVIYCDHTPIGRYLNAKKINYTLGEDGLDVFKNKYYELTKKFEPNIIDKLFILLKIKFPCMGRSKYTKVIEVNDKTDLTISSDNIVEVNINELVSKLSEDDKQLIFNIFIDRFDAYIIDTSKKNILILTQPLYKDDFLESESEQINVYKRILSEYSTKDLLVYIKPHPRDDINYADISSELIIIPKDIPIEIFNFSNCLHFDSVITISSTSIDSIRFCNKKIVLGMEYLK